MRREISKSFQGCHPICFTSKKKGYEKRAMTRLGYVSSSDDNLHHVFDFHHHLLSSLVIAFT